MHGTVPLHIPFAALADFCRRYQMRELALFGSMLRKARSCPWILWSKPAATDKMGNNAGVTPLIGLGGVPKAAHIAW